MKTYTLTGNLSYDNREYLVGESIKLPDEVAATLGDLLRDPDAKPVDGGPLDGAGGVAATAGATEGGAALADGEILDYLVQACGELDRDQKDHWTKDGRPQVAALEALTGIDINAAQRDQAWDAFNEQNAG